MLPYIIIAIIMFGVLIAVHEFGHFSAAKLLGVKVNEFSIGMGPLLLSKQKGETLYSLRALPIGGFCAMEGEDEDSEDPRSFGSQKAWKKFIILVAGAWMNFLTGFLILVLLFSQLTVLNRPVIEGFMDGFPLQGEEGLLPGDRIVKIDGERVYVYADVSLLFSRSNGQTMDLVIERNGELLQRNDFPLRLREYQDGEETVWRYGIYFQTQNATWLDRLKESWSQSIDFVRLVRMGLVDLFTGTAGLQDMSGPIGIVDAISTVGADSPTLGVAAWNILYFVALIAVNLAVMNLLPIPALDGGRIFFLLVNGVFTLITRRKLDPKYEGYINMAGFFCLIALMVVVAFNDVVKLFQ